MNEPRIRVLSLGAGVQSTTLALMAAAGEIGPMPDCAVFSDTGWEPEHVYRHLDWLKGQLPFPVHVISAGNIRDDILSNGSGRAGRYAAVPWFLKSPDGKKGMGRRQCTMHYKVEPIRKEIRKLLGYKPRARIPAGAAEIWIGISTNESFRVKPSPSSWEVRRWPLIEVGMNRTGCLGWMNRNGFPQPPKSSCVGCPFHSNVMWREMRRDDPAAFADAIEVDKAIRRGGSKSGMRGEQFMHPSCIPLDKAPIGSADQIDMFNNDCEGMCGV